MGYQKALGKHMLWVMSIFALLFITIGYGWTFDDNQVNKTISGKVSDVDWVKSIITIRYSHFISGNIDEINIIVSGETKIMNGTVTKSLSDIEQFDSVTVTYYDDGLSGLKAISITDLNVGNR
ncbi:MAG: hypothetical protein V1670_01940 [Candidatus Omnitrophota bacterium]